MVIVVVVVVVVVVAGGGDGSEFMTPLVVKACTEVQPMMAITDTTDSSSLDTLFFVGIMAVQIDCIVWLSLYCIRWP